MTTLAAITGGVLVAGSSTPNFDTRPDGALETIAAADDGDYGAVTTNTSGTYTDAWALDNMPSDFGTMNTLSVRLRYGWSATPTNSTWDTLAARIMSSDRATVLAAASAAGAYETVASSITVTTPTNSAVIPFTYVNTGANKTAWDDAIIEIQIVRTRNKSGGSEGQRVYAGEITGDYTAAINHSRTPTQGDIALSMTAPTVTRTLNVSISPAQGNITISATAPTVDRTDHVEITPTQGFVFITTTPPTVSTDAGHAAQPPPADLVISATAPSIEITSGHFISPPQGNLVVSRGAIAPVGSVLEYELTSYGNTGTVASDITVPADADFVVVGVSGYGGVVDYFSAGSMTFTKGASQVAMTPIGGGDSDTAAWQCAMFCLAAPDTGANKTLNWDWLGTGGPSNIYAKVSIRFFKNVSSLRASGGGQSATTPPFTSSPIASLAGDYIVAFAGWWTTNESSIDSWLNLTEVLDLTRNVNADGAWADNANASANIVVEATAGTNVFDGGIVAVALVSNAPSVKVQHAPTTVVASIGTRSAENVNITSVVAAGNNEYTVTLSAAPSNTVVGDLLTDEAASPNNYLILGISGADLTVRDCFGAGVAPSAAGSSQATTVRCYSTITAWEADLDDTDLYVTGDQAIGECYNDSAFDEEPTISGGETVGLASTHLTVAATDRHDGTEGTGARNLASTYDGRIVVSSSATVARELSWLELDGNAHTPSYIFYFVIADIGTTNDKPTSIHHMLAHGINTTTFGPVGISIGNQVPSPLGSIHNNIVYDLDSQAPAQFPRGIIASKAHAYNNTVDNIGGTAGGQGFFTNDGNPQGDRRNNVGTNCSNVVWENPGGATMSHNASDDASHPGTNGVAASAATEYVSLTAGAEDYHLKTGSNLIGAGVDLGAVDWAIDIDGRDRDAQGDIWDIGADQFVANPPVIPSQGNLVISATAPTVEVSAGSSPNITPARADLAISTTAPTVATTANHFITPKTFGEKIAGFWKCEEFGTQYATFVDSTPNGHDGVTQYANPQVAGLHGNGYINGTGSAETVHIAPFNDASPGVDIWTAVSWVKVPALPTDPGEYLFSKWQNPFEWRSLLFQTTGFVAFERNGSNGWSTVTSTVGITPGQWEALFYTVNKKTNLIKIALNGGSEDTASDNPAGGRKATTSSMDIGVRYSAAGYQATFDDVFIIVGYDLTDADRAWIYNSGSGRTYEELLEYKAGLTISSVAPTVDLTAHVDVTPTQGNLVLSSTAPTVQSSASTGVAPSQGNLSLSTTAPSVQASAHVSATPSQGDLAISSVAPIVQRSANVAVSPARGDLAISTSQPTVASTDNHFVAPARGDVTISSIASTVALTDNRDIAPSQGNLATSSVAPTVQSSASTGVSPARANLIISSQAPLVLATDHHSITVSQGNEIISTVAPTVSVSDNHAVAPAQGDLVLSTTAPTVSTIDNHFVTSAAGNLTISSIAPTVQAGASINAQPSQGDLVVSTAPPSVAFTDHQSIAPSSGDLAISGFAPSVDAGQNQSVSPSSGTLLLSATPPAIDVGAAIDVSPSAAALILSGSQPAVSIQTTGSVSITVPSNLLLISGFAPSVSISRRGSVRYLQGAVGSVTLSGSKQTSPSLAGRTSGTVTLKGEV